ncbi:hypothetical protein [Flammeovirga kamogawensis]|uniref:Uncharacterized protein n=1 Tax=Flammeovirga kamogawensis TaxID=373891 RepID=A0ABX8H3Z5_9BACT|nr:hypothetical protein [Flammeovirga kamogawensis]MBB6460352.1 hypothetical protein [Flammeovirga kamogawensis]QWG10161.1 hypothetical protein KM029_20985 [Flammeovirga kamogawensis]TRX64613.1 hypothetical protein EO216_18915 [Flammeovirga kamogawensis]
MVISEILTFLIFFFGDYSNKEITVKINENDIFYAEHFDNLYSCQDAIFIEVSFNTMTYHLESYVDIGLKDYYYENIKLYSSAILSSDELELLVMIGNSKEIIKLIFDKGDYLGIESNEKDFYILQKSGFFECD